ncbi:MTAP family purine nucleoside phosphorylase [Methylotenera sp.]|uniref:MTAP family purine nucleoside phosphorylase n=1 Tax=Methylotenera sp. TaxID=2051956 RepID=UPI0027346AC9|nr:MTAP family purine nucleoside phosphorylase [Methylotenera sp.]MDP3004666.1 MTAP family purine nucleoside phosphorylase [Methylotenera sp.]
MLAILGGTGIYALDEVEVLEEIEITTPFGEPSGKVVKGRWGTQELFFLARHGAGHRLLPHEINYRANIFALKSLGVTQILGLSAIGSLSEEMAPGDFVMPDQYFDWTKGKRLQTFFGAGVAAHVSMAEPVSANLVTWVAKGASQCGYKLHAVATYACVEGPRLGTRAESLFLCQAGCQVVGMTNVPEVFLAREAQICYATLGIVTDYDCWMEDSAMHVKATEIFEQYGRSLGNAMSLLGYLMKGPLPPEDPEIRTALSYALLTPRETLTADQCVWFEKLTL